MRIIFLEIWRILTYFYVFYVWGKNTRILPYFITGLNVRNNSAPNCSNWLSIFWRPFLVVTLLNNDHFLVFTVQEDHLYGPIYVALSSPSLPLRQNLKPFATNKALSGPFYSWWGAFTPVDLPVGSSGVVCAGSESHVAQSCYSVAGDKPFLWSKAKFLPP